MRILFFGTAEFAKSYLSMWDAMKTNKKVGILYPNDADGNAVRANLAPLHHLREVRGLSR